jgi:6-phosphogluconolactonase
MKCLPAALRVFEDPEGVAEAGCREFCGRARGAIEHGQVFTCVLSGGSTPRLMFDRLAQPATLAVLPAGVWRSVHFFWGDERDVPPGHPDSNYHTARQALLDRIDIPEANVHRIRPEVGSADRAAAEYEEELVRFFHLRRGEFPRFDLIYLGMGEDGHTASLFPYNRDLRENVRLVAAPWVERLNARRITLTLPVINRADCVVFLVAGKQKAARLRDVLGGTPDPQRLPAQQVRPLSGELLWLADRAAASEIED